MNINYYPGGMLMPGRTYSIANTNYRYGFNGQEKSTEINNSSYMAEYWQYDSRLVRRWNIDPKPITAISPYNCFSGNPILHSDILGDSIGPGRTNAYNVFVVGKKRDLWSDLSAKRFRATQEKNPTNTILIETDNLNESIANDIITKLGPNGYINTLAIDYHRSAYDDEMSNSDKDKFYNKLSKGYTGDKTCVLLGMCWSGGGPANKKMELPDLTKGISKSLDKATVYGLKTEAANIPFWMTGNFGVFNPAYAFDSGAFGKNERENESVWTISKYSPTLKKYTSEKVHENIILSLQGQIIRYKITPPKSGLDGTVRYEYGRIM